MDRDTLAAMDLNKKIDYFQSQQSELREMEKVLKNKKEVNNMELSMAFGIEPGQPMSIVDLLSNLTGLALQ